MPAGKRKLDDIRNDINVTPLVDVCLVLLIIFMVVTDKLQRGMEVPLPSSRFHTSRPQTDRPIVSVAPGSIYWDRERLTGTDELKRRAAEELQRTDQPIHVKASAELSYEEVYPVLMALHEAGSPRVELATQEMRSH